MFVGKGKLDSTFLCSLKMNVVVNSLCPIHLQIFEQEMERICFSIKMEWKFNNSQAFAFPESESDHKKLVEKGLDKHQAWL